MTMWMIMKMKKRRKSKPKREVKEEEEVRMKRKNVAALKGGNIHPLKTNYGGVCVIL